MLFVHPDACTRSGKVMTMQTPSYLRVFGLLVIAFVGSLVAAACGGDNPCSDPTAPGCGGGAPLDLPTQVIEALCVQPAITETSDLQTLAVSALSSNDCRSEDLGQEGGRLHEKPLGFALRVVRAVPDSLIPECERNVLLQSVTEVSLYALARTGSSCSTRLADT